MSEWKSNFGKDNESIELRAAFEGELRPFKGTGVQTRNEANVLIVVYEDRMVISQNGKWEMTYEQFDEMKKAVLKAGTRLHYHLQDIEKDARCVFCESTSISESVKTDSFQYGADNSAVMLSARVPVMSCKYCKQQWTDWRAEEIRQRAVDDHLANKGIHLCVVCHRVAVDTSKGIDTCDSCIEKV